MVTSSVESREPWVSGAILAGGLARRMGGADKASLLVGGTRIIDRQLAALATVADDIRIIGPDPSRYAGLPIPVTGDAIAGAGALGGLYTALLHATHTRLIVLACDLPFVTATLLARLVAESDAAGDEVDAVIPRSTRGLEPLCALYWTRCAAAVRARIERGELRVGALVHDLRVRELGVGAFAPDDEGRLFENVNTPHDYERAREVELNAKPSKDRITE